MQQNPGVRYTRNEIPDRYLIPSIYPLTLDTNIGTCITALRAATAVASTEARPALQIAMVHLWIWIVAQRPFVEGLAAVSVAGPETGSWIDSQGRMACESVSL